MKTKKIFKYVILDSLKEIKVFFIVYSAIIILLSILSIYTTDSGRFSFNGTEFNSIILFFVMGLCAFKGHFHFSLVNSTPRKNLFLGTLGSFGVLSIMVAFINNVIAFILTRFINTLPIFFMIYNKKYPDITSKQALESIGYTFSDFIWNATLLFAIAIIGYFITILYYKMNKTLKVVVSVSIPVILVIGLPVLDGMFGGKIISSILNFILTIMGLINGQSNNLIATLSFVCISGVFALLSYLLVRRMTVKSKN